MSNLRIKNKRLKKELEMLKYSATPPIHVTCSRKEIIKLGSSLMLTEGDLEHLSECENQVKWMLFEEAKDHVKVDFITPGTNDSGLPYPILKAELSVVKKEN